MIKNITDEDDIYILEDAMPWYYDDSGDDIIDEEYDEIYYDDFYAADYDDDEWDSE